VGDEIDSDPDHVAEGEARDAPIKGGGKQRGSPVQTSQAVACGFYEEASKARAGEVVSLADESPAGLASPSSGQGAHAPSIQDQENETALSDANAFMQGEPWGFQEFEGGHENGQIYRLISEREAVDVSEDQVACVPPSASLTHHGGRPVEADRHKALSG
jgi:hypothetical protein